MILFILCFAVVGVLHSLGAPDGTRPQVASQVPLAARSGPGAGWNGRVAAPDPALTEASRSSPGVLLPRSAADGRTSMQVYARPFNAADPRPRIGLLVTGLGILEAESLAAIQRLPGPVSLAVSAYGQRLEPLLQAARDNGHELLASIPMESAGFPQNDAGPRSLLTGASQEANQRNLDAVLGRIGGYVGATGASDGMRGERFVASAGFGWVAGELSRRGLLYVDPRPPAQGMSPRSKRSSRCWSGSPATVVPPSVSPPPCASPPSTGWPPGRAPSRRATSCSRRSAPSCSLTPRPLDNRDA